MSERDVDALVRGHLHRQAQEVDAAALLTGVKARLAARAPRPRSRSRQSLWWGMAAAAALAAVLFGGQNLAPPAQAGAETLVRQARQAHAQPVDRCYQVEIVPDARGPLMRHPLLAQTRQTRLWTRGDRFWIDSANPQRRWAWGRDEQGSLWLALGRGRGVRFERDEVPESVGLACDVCGMRVEALLDEVLAGFDLRREPGAPAGTERIRATRRTVRSAPSLREAVLDIDTSSRVLRRLQLQRTRRGLPLATVTFTLAESQPQGDALYQLAGHLAPGATVWDRNDHNGQRATLLKKFFGAPLVQALP